MSARLDRPVAYIEGIGLSVVKKVDLPKDVDILNLATNESSFGASQAVLNAIREQAEKPHRYPDPLSTELRHAIGQHFDLEADQIVCGNGSEELLDGIGRIYARPGDEILFSEYGFLQFPIVAYRVGATAIKAPSPNLTANVDTLLENVTDRTKILFLANPENPTGTYIPASEVRRLRDNLPRRIVLVVDSVYCEYVDDPDFTDGLELVEGHNNVIVIRTFSKAWGLAGLRVGWAYCSASMAAALNTMRGIGNVNAMAQAGAVAALSDPSHVDKVRRETDQARKKFIKDLSRFGVTMVPGAANFVLVKFPATQTNRKAVDAFRHLVSEGIIVRTNEDYGLDDYLRITIGTIEECDQVIDSLDRFFN